MAAPRRPAPAIDGRRVALATHRAAAAPTADDCLLLEAIERQLGARAVAAPWDGEGVDWTSFDAVLVRSTWNYHLDAAAFVAWTERLTARGVAVWNPPAVVRWNADKGYLRELARHGVPVVPTEWIVRGSSRDPASELASALSRRGWRRAVVKPSVGVTAFRTWRIDAAETDGSNADHGERLATLLADADALVQPFLDVVRRDGEWSFVYFADGTGPLSFSHAVVKRPARGDFRVQNQYGGSVEARTPPAALLRRVDRTAAAVERLAPGPLLYARLDGVVSDGAHAPGGEFLLMEAELIEPVLYFEHSGGGAGRLADALSGVSRLARPEAG